MASLRNQLPTASETDSDVVSVCGIATMSLSALEISARGVNLVRKQILRSFSFRWKMSSRWKIILSSLCLATVLFAVLRPCSGYKDYALALMFDQGQTVFAPMFREQNFKKVSVGMTSNEVQVLLGVPLAESWWYGFSHDIRDVFLCIDIEHNIIVDAHWWDENSWNKEELQSISSKIKPGTSISEIQSIVFNIPTPSQGYFQKSFTIARPVTVLWAYSMTTNSSSYHQRIIYFQDGKVYRKVASFYVD